MNINQELKIADVVSDNIKTADIFKKYGIDFCCGGGISIARACERKNINLEVLLDELNQSSSNSSPSQDHKKWSLDFLADYIINTHHKYVLEAFDILDHYANKVVKVHGENHPPLKEIVPLYMAIKQELLHHMLKEEQILFPYIKNLVAAKKENRPALPPHFGKVENPIHMMQLEHENAGEIFRQISILTQQYTPPVWACNTFIAFYSKLDEFERDLHLHVHLENNILFPKTIQLENELQTFN
ncbi:MAG: iron-sulfur cluster repair di-iron protein [Chitinophagaceae bacterium]|nr:iron-sulfur cluster repair di-iron protein [Chitinophagaceae bacterium]